MFRRIAIELSIAQFHIAFDEEEDRFDNDRI